MLKVMIFLHSFEPGGVERVAFRLADAWTGAGLVPTMALGRAEGAAAPDCLPCRIEVFQRGTFSTRRFETLWMIANLPRLVIRERPDILFCAGNTYAVVAVALRLILGRQCPPLFAARLRTAKQHRCQVWRKIHPAGLHHPGLGGHLGRNRAVLRPVRDHLWRGG